MKEKSNASIIGVLLVRDEEEIIDDCIRHHLSNGVDNFIVTDNGSADHTREKVAKYPEVLELIDEPGRDYRQGEWVTRMNHLAYRRGAAWVVPIDADEFWYGLEALRTIPEHFGVVMTTALFNHLPTVGLVYGEFDRSRMPYCVRYAVRRIALRPDPNAVVEQGNHGVLNHPGAMLVTEAITVHHYSIRSYEQFERKVVNGGDAYQRYPGPADHGWHWRGWYATWRQGRLREIYESMVLPESRIDQTRPLPLPGPPGSYLFPHRPGCSDMLDRENNARMQ